jgi:hypothetical protein
VQQLDDLAQRRALTRKGEALERFFHGEPGGVDVLFADRDVARLANEGGEDDRQLDGTHFS